MKAVGYRANWPVDHAEALLDLELPAPVPSARDVLGWAGMPWARWRRWAVGGAGRVGSTVSTSFGRINAHNLRKAHALIETGKAHGKVVLARF